MTSSSGFASLAFAQERGWQDNRHFRPVASAQSNSPSRPNSFAPQRQASTPTQRSGWNLQWRTSPTVAAEQARKISDAAFDGPVRDVWDEASQPESAASPVSVAQHRMQTTGTHDNAVQAPPTVVPHTASPRHSVASNHLRDAQQTPIQRVAWLNQNAVQSGSGFSVPDNLFRDGTATPEVVPPGRSSFGLPSDSAAPVQELPVPRGAQEIPNELSDLFEIDPPASPQPIQPEPVVPQPNMVQPAPAADAPSALTPSAPKDNSSIRDMIQDEPAPTPRNSGGLADDLDQLESPSDRDTFAPNPFGGRSEERAREREEREEARERRRVEEGTQRPSIFSDDDGPASSGTGLSCDDFRSRIEASTIDQVSLDISPPFRPDVIDNDEYAKLRGKFSAKQESRVWRSIDGRPLGTGRLEDLAYEKAVISTDFGSREELPLNRLSESDLAYISQNWGLPTECLIEQVAYTPRSWTPTTMTWTASNLCHKPLYFEEVNLERYGHTAGPFAQPVISSAHFFFNIAVLPYKMGVHSPHECQYALGYYRPGNCAPWIVPPVPLSVKGAWYQAAAMTGAALLIP